MHLTHVKPAIQLQNNDKEQKGRKGGFGELYFCQLSKMCGWLSLIGKNHNAFFCKHSGTPLESLDIVRDINLLGIVDSFGELISLRSEVNSVALLL